MRFNPTLLLVAVAHAAPFFHSADSPSPARRDLPYSVVQVDGSSSSSSLTPAPAPAVQTVAVTQPASPVINTIIETATPSAASPQTLLITTTATATPTPAPPADPSTPHVVIQTVTTVATLVAAPPAPSSTSYYDDGLWHTYYPIKSWDPMTSRPAAATGTGSWGAWSTGSSGAGVEEKRRGAGEGARRFKRAARVPAGVEVESWNVTGSEMREVQRFA